MAKTIRIVFIAVFVTFCLIVIVDSLLKIQRNLSTPTPTLQNTKKQSPRISPAPTTIVPHIQYQNPFDEKTQYANPFATYENPFATLK